MINMNLLNSKTAGTSGSAYDGIRAWGRVLPGGQVVLHNLGVVVDLQVTHVTVLPEGPVWHTINGELGGCRLAIYYKICPHVAKFPGNVPVIFIEIKDSRGEEVDQLVPVSHSSGYGGLVPREQEVPEGMVSVVFKGIEVGLGADEVIVLHELVSGGFNEEGPNKIDQAINHLTPVTQLLIFKVSVVDELIDDSTVILETEGLQKSGAEQMPEEEIIVSDIIGDNVGVVDHSQNKGAFVLVCTKYCFLRRRRAIGNAVTQIFLGMLGYEFLMSVSLCTRGGTSETHPCSFTFRSIVLLMSK